MIEVGFNEAFRNLSAVLVSPFGWRESLIRDLGMHIAGLSEPVNAEVVYCIL